MSSYPKSRINRTLWLLAVILLGSTVAPAQQSTCSLKIDVLPDSAELRGFRLGMTYDQVKALIPQVRFGPADAFGVAKTSINPYFDPTIDKIAFADMRTISLDFLDGRLVTLWIGFESSFKWGSLKEFVAGMSKALRLPAAWSPNRRGQEMNCTGFSILASTIAGGPSIRIRDETAQAAIASRREEAAAALEAQVIGDQTTKIYYPAECTALDGVAAANQIRFKDKAEAEKAGFKLSKDCQ